MEDINLDFLVSPPRQQQLIERPSTPLVSTRMPQRFDINKCRKRKLDIVQNIAKVDELVQEIDKYKQDNTGLQRQLKDFQKTALEVQNLYTEEKRKFEKVNKEFIQLKEHYENVDSDLANKTMKYEQIKARLADYEGRPINYDNLVLKYIRILLKLEAEDSESIRYFQDKSILEDLIQYCKQMKLKLPIIKSPKKTKSRTVKPKTVDAFVQCTSDVAEHNATIKEQNIECKIERRDQASQYISTMITRQTNTEKIIQKNVSTMFPEPKPTPPINDILNVFCKWGNVQSVTPLDSSPISQSKKFLKASPTSISIGTCTMLCNIRRKIDYLPPITPGIKQELNTPSPSPIPTTNTASVTSNTTRLNNPPMQPSTIPAANMNNRNSILPSSLLTLFNATSSSALGQLSSNAFNELWQIFGTMLLSLLQTNNAGIVNTNQNSINQQQFLDWLLELYMNSSNSRSQQNISQQVSSTQTSPLHFNESSLLTSTNILRPQAMKSLPNGQENVIGSQSELSNDHDTYMQQNVATSQMSTARVEDFCEDSNSMDREIQEIQNSTNEIEIQTDINETNSNQPVSCSIEITTKPRKDRKNKHKIIDEIQEILPEIKLNKKKCKALKRLLKDKKHKKKSAKNRNDKNLVTNQSEDNNIETAVDFLSTFVQNQDSEFDEYSLIKENIFSTEIDFTENIDNLTKSSDQSVVQTEMSSSLNIISNNNDDFTFIKPAVNQYLNYHHSTKSLSASNNSTFIKPAKKSKKSKISKTIENKYQMLFGDSDSEIENEEDISKNKQINPVTNAVEDNTKDFENYECSQYAVREDLPQEITNLTHQSKSSYAIFNDNTSVTSMNINILNESSQDTNNEIFLDISNREQFTIPEIPTPLLKNLENNYFYENPVNLIRLSNVSDVLIDQIEQLEVQNTAMHQHIEMQSTSNDLNSRKPCEDFPNNIDRDLELSSDVENVEEENEECNNENPNGDANTYHTQYYNYCSLPDIQDGNSRETNAKTIIYSNIASTKNHNIDGGSLPNLDDTNIPQDDCTSISDINSKQTQTIKKLPNVENQNTEIEEAIKPTIDSVKEPYCASDFEKDFELSSDNESELTDIDSQGQDEYHPAINISFSPKKNVQHTNQQTANNNAEDSNLKISRNSKTRFSSDSFGESADIQSQDIEQNLHPTDKKNKVSFTNNSINKDHNTSLHASSDSLNESEENDNAAICQTSKEDTDSLTDSEENNNAALYRISEEDSDSLTEPEEIDNAAICPTSEEYTVSLTDSKGNNNAALYQTSKEDSGSLTASEEIDNAAICLTSKKDFKDFELQNNPLSNPSDLKIAHIERTKNMKQDFKYFQQVQNNEEQHMPDIDNAINPSPLKLNSLPDFTETFIQLKDPNLESRSKNEQISITSEHDVENKTESETSSVCWSVITVPDTTSTTEDEEVESVIEISTDNTTCLNNSRDLDSPIVNDLVIDEDDVQSETDDDFNREEEEQAKEIVQHSESISKNKTEDHKTKSKELKTESLNNTISYCGETKKDDSLNSSSISTLLDSTLYNEILTDSIKPIVNDLLEENDVLNMSPLPTKSKRGRKRKSECLIEVQPCKRSNRLKAKQIILEQSLNLSTSPIEIGKYTRNQYNSIKDLKPSIVPEIKMRNTTNHMKKTNDICKSNDEGMKTNDEFKNSLPTIRMGFFKERITENEIKPITNTINATSSIYHPKTISKQTIFEMDMLMESNVDIEESNIAEITHKEHAVEELAEEKATNKLDTKSPNEDFCEYSDSPKSPPPSSIEADTNNCDLNATIVIIPQERSIEYIPQQKNATLFDTLISSYSTNNRINILPECPKVLKHKDRILQQLEKDIKLYCYNEMQLDPDHTALQLINQLLRITNEYNLIQKALVNIAQNAESSNVLEKDLPSIIQEMPPRHLSCCLQRLFFVLKHFLNKNDKFCEELIVEIESVIFSSQNNRITTSLQVTLNLTQLYLMACKNQEALITIINHPARIYIAKCLYYYNKGATVMVHEVLLWYPTVLPHREDTTYDRSDALITVIQQLLMNTKYDMENQELRGKSLISKLRYEYHYEIYKPTLDEVIINLMEKLKFSKFYNISLSFGLLCKRFPPIMVEQKILLGHLMPLAKEYYSKALHSTEYDSRISAILNTLSLIVKPFPLDWNIEVYLKEFSRFLNDFDSPVIQEAALCSILRLQRFGYVNCFNLLRHFNPTYNLDNHTEAMLKTFIHRKQLKFWKTLKYQNPKN